LSLKNTLSGSDSVEKLSFVVCSNTRPEDFDSSFLREGRFALSIETKPFTEEAQAKALYDYLSSNSETALEWKPFVWKPETTLAQIAALGRKPELLKLLDK
jgi:SpoVK/Ycf46/Vps4 family AAA+-type ATPase